MMTLVDDSLDPRPRPVLGTPPFDARLLDSLMEEAGIDIVVATSRHNLRYLLGGYSFFFFDRFDAIGVARYVPALVYVKGRPDLTLYVGNTMESYEHENRRIWVPHVAFSTWSSGDTAGLILDHIRKSGLNPRRIGVEFAFMPTDMERSLTSTAANLEYREALPALERLRARKLPAELRLLREASERVVDAMLAVIAAHGPGITTRELASAVRREEEKRELHFEYCLVTTGTSLNRAPSDRRWENGGILSLDSGGNFGGYIGDVCRMAILGEPDTELVDLLAGIEEVQRAARIPIRAGAIGGEIYEAAERVLRGLPNASGIHFVAHGMGLIPHEAPWLTSAGPVPYDGVDADRPLEAGMVLSIETTLPHPRRGFIKLEDTVAVTATGCEGFGDGGRGWNRGGTRA
jgi:Xaa-Pro aminopeptidase